VCPEARGDQIQGRNETARPRVKAQRENLGDVGLSPWREGDWEAAEPGVLPESGQLR